MADDDPAPDDDLLTLPSSRAFRFGAAAALVVLAAIAALVVLAAIAAPGAALGTDPTPEPGATPRPPTCTERFPDEGPAGVDLRLGCIVSEVVGLYTAGQPGPPPTLSAYLLTLGGVVVVAVVVALLVGRALRRSAGRRLAPVLAGEWWVCSQCHSVNGAGVAHCYSCGASPPDGPLLQTDGEPLMPQSFGSTRKRG